MAEVIVYYLADCLAASQAFAVIKFMTERRNIKFSFYTAGSAGAFLFACFRAGGSDDFNALVPIVTRGNDFALGISASRAYTALFAILGAGRSLGHFTGDRRFGAIYMGLVVGADALAGAGVVVALCPCVDGITVSVTQFVNVCGLSSSTDGAGIGLDRLSMIMCGADSLRDVIAFPKVQNASEPMSGAPAPAEQKALDELALALTDKE